MNLTINEQLMRDTKDANLCIFIANLATWLRYNIDKEKPEQRNIHEGRCWSYNSIKDLQNYFDFWSVKNIRTIIKHCQQQGLILIGNFNKHKYDQTSWYTFTDKALCYYPSLKKRFNAESGRSQLQSDLPEVANAISKNGKPIPELHTIGSINTTTSNVVRTEEVIEAYHETLPECPKIKVCGNELTKQIRSMIKSWPKYQKQGQPFSIESFKDYLNYIKQHYAWFIQPYVTESGKTKRNNLTNITREKNIVRIVNGEFSAN